MKVKYSKSVTKNVLLKINGGLDSKGEDHNSFFYKKIKNEFKYKLFKN